jgi:hypothetical protein
MYLAMLLPAWPFVSTSPLAMSIVMPCCVSTLTNLSIITPHKREMSLSTKPRGAYTFATSRNHRPDLVKHHLFSRHGLPRAQSPGFPRHIPLVQMGAYRVAAWKHVCTIATGQRCPYFVLLRQMQLCQCSVPTSRLGEHQNIDTIGSLPSSSFSPQRLMGYIPNPGSKGINDYILQWP